MKSLRCTLLVLALAASAASFIPGGGPGVPPTDSCDQSSIEGVASLVILAVNGDDPNPIADKQIMPIIFGSQGGSMLRMRFQLEGDPIPSCTTFSITLDQCQGSDCEQVIDNARYEREVSLATYEQGSARVTRDYYLILPSQFVGGSLLRLQVQAGLGTQERLLWLDYMGELPEALRDGGIPDAARDADLGLGSAPDTGL